MISDTAASSSTPLRPIAGLDGLRRTLLRIDLRSRRHWSSCELLPDPVTVPTPRLQRAPANRRARLRCDPRRKESHRRVPHHRAPSSLKRCLTSTCIASLRGPPVISSGHRPLTRPSSFPTRATAILFFSSAAMVTDHLTAMEDESLCLSPLRRSSHN